MRHGDVRSAHGAARWVWGVRQECVEDQTAAYIQEKAAAQQAVLGALDMLMGHKQHVQDAISQVIVACQDAMEAHA